MWEVKPWARRLLYAAFLLVAIGLGFLFRGLLVSYERAELSELTRENEEQLQQLSQALLQAQEQNERLTVLETQMEEIKKEILVLPQSGAEGEDLPAAAGNESPQPSEPVPQASAAEAPAPSPAEASAEDRPEPATAEKVNLNTATLEELQTLPGIGEVKAKAIVAYRESHDGFKTVDQLEAVKGIGAKTLEKLLPLIRVE